MMNTGPVKRFLPVPLTDNEKIFYGQRLARLHQEYIDIEHKKKTEADRFKDELESVDGRSSHLASIIREGSERREVECQWRYLFETNSKELVRMDSGEIVETLAITADERQLMLQMDQEKETETAAIAKKK